MSAEQSQILQGLNLRYTPSHAVAGFSVIVHKPHESTWQEFVASLQSPEIHLQKAAIVRHRYADIACWGKEWLKSIVPVGIVGNDFSIFN